MRVSLRARVWRVLLLRQGRPPKKSAHFAVSARCYSFPPRLLQAGRDEK